MLLSCTADEELEEDEELEDEELEEDEEVFGLEEAEEGLGDFAVEELDFGDEV